MRIWKSSLIQGGNMNKKQTKAKKIVTSANGHD